MADIATLSRTRMLAALKSAKARLANLREAAEEAATRSIVLAGNAAGGALTGFVVGRAERDGRDITVGDSNLRWTLLGALAVGGLGAFAPRLLGDSTANMALGLGGGGVGFETGLWGYERGKRPAT